MKTHELKWVTFRRLNRDGTVHHVSRAQLYTIFNSVTGRYVVPVRMQEGTARVSVRTAGNELEVDVTREDD